MATRRTGIQGSVRCDSEDFRVHSSYARLFSAKEASMMFNTEQETRTNGRMIVFQ